MLSSRLTVPARVHPPKSHEKFHTSQNKFSKLDKVERRAYAILIPEMNERLCAAQKKKKKKKKIMYACPNKKKIREPLKMSYSTVIVGPPWRQNKKQYLPHGRKIISQPNYLQCHYYLEPSFDDSPGLVAAVDTTSLTGPFMPTPPTPSKLPNPLLAVISAQSHSNVIGICHRSCGMKGCVNVFPISIGSTAPPDTGCTGFMVGVVLVWG